MKQLETPFRDAERRMRLSPLFWCRIKVSKRLSEWFLEMINAKLFLIMGLETPFWNAEKRAIWYAFEPEIRFYVEVINAKLFWNAFKCIVFRMKLRNAAPQPLRQWQSLPRDSYSRYWEIDDKRNNLRKAFRKAFRIAIWLWVLKRVSKEENTAKVRSDTRLSQKHISVEMINAKLFWNAFTMCPRKKNPETMDKSCGMCCYYHIYFMKYD